MDASDEAAGIRLRVVGLSSGGGPRCVSSHWLDRWAVLLSHPLRDDGVLLLAWLSRISAVSQRQIDLSPAPHSAGVRCFQADSLMPHSLLFCRLWAAESPRRVARQIRDEGTACRRRSPDRHPVSSTRRGAIGTMGRACRGRSWLHKSRTRVGRERVKSQSRPQENREFELPSCEGNGSGRMAAAGTAHGMRSGPHC